MFILPHICTVGAMKTCCKADRNSYSQIDSDIRFKSKPETPAVVCTLTPITICCCMSNFRRIQWFKREGNVWRHVEESYPDSRHFFEQDQTVRFGAPSHADAGQYKCVGYGRSAAGAEKVIGANITFFVRDCYNKDHLEPLYPSQNHTKEATTPGSEFHIRCIGEVGPRHTSCDGGKQCGIGWNRTVDGHTMPVSDIASERVHVVNEWMFEDNGLKSTLHISSVIERDFDGEYSCWMKNKYVKLDPARTLSLQRRHVRSVTKYSEVSIATIAACGGIVALAGVASLFAWRYRLRFKLWLKRRRRIPLKDEDLEYDVVLMHSDDSQLFVNFFYQELTTRQHQVFRYDDDVMFGAKKHEALMDVISKSRSVLAVISPAFIADNYCLFGFENAVRDGQVDVIYVLYDGIRPTSTDDDRLCKALSAEVLEALRNSRRRFVSPLSEEDFANHVDTETVRRKADPFVVKMCLKIPDRRRKDRARAGEERKPLLA